MRIRKPFAGAFVALCLVAGYSGFAALPPIPYQEYHSDKILHFLAFFLITTSFYWILETSRRRVLNLTLTICTGILAVGSEVAQGIIPNGREFDYLDIVANVVGSLAAAGLSTAYHRRMLERRRVARGFRSAGAEDGAPGVDDLELGEGTGAQEIGVVREQGVDIDAELDNWDENAADDWDNEGNNDDAHGKANGTSKETQS